MNFSNPLIQRTFRHLFALVCSVLLLFLFTFVVDPHLYVRLFQLAQSVSEPSRNTYFHIQSIAAFEWPILLLLIITVELISRQSGKQRFWIWLLLLTLSFLLFGFAYWGLGNWVGLENRDFSAIVTTVIHGLHTGLQAAFYWIAYTLGGRLFQQDNQSLAVLTNPETTA